MLFTLLRSPLTRHLPCTDVKAASEAGLQVALFNRPGGRKNRTYYKIRFPNAYNMEKIQLL